MVRKAWPSGAAGTRAGTTRIDAAYDTDSEHSGRDDCSRVSVVRSWGCADAANRLVEDPSVHLFLQNTCIWVARWSCRSIWWASGGQTGLRNKGGEEESDGWSSCKVAHHNKRCPSPSALVPAPPPLKSDTRPWKAAKEALEPQRRPGNHRPRISGLLWWGRLT